MHTSVDLKSTGPINSSAPTRSSPGKISRTPRCIRTRRWNGVCGEVEKEFGDRWEDRHHFKTKPAVRAHLRNQRQWYGEFLAAVPQATMWRALPDCAEVALKSYDKTWCVHNASRLASPTLVKLEDTKATIRLIAGITCIALFASCATGPQTLRGPEYAPTANLMREARSANVQVEKRAADYLQAAAMTAPLLATGIGTPACETYNAACGELTILLRSSEGGRLWNHPLTLTASNQTYRLWLEPASNNVWSPDYFTSFVPSSEIKEKLIKKGNYQEGVGGSLVGVRNATPPEKFAAHKGIPAAVTATLDFKRNDATLALRRPFRQPTAVVQGKIRPLSADFSAPIGYYQPPPNLLLVSLMAMLRSSNYMDKTGLYFLQPYDPDRIPLVFVHGLFSTPFDWVQT